MKLGRRRWAKRVHMLRRFRNLYVVTKCGQIIGTNELVEMPKSTLPEHSRLYLCKRCKEAPVVDCPY